MHHHFPVDEGPETRLRYIIYQLMDHYEKMDEVMSALLSFSIEETHALDRIEKHLIDMEKFQREMNTLVKQFEEGQTVLEEMVYKSSPLYEAVRRTYNLLSGLNVIDLNHDSWVSKTTRCLIDRVYYRQIKSLVYKNPQKK